MTDRRELPTYTISEAAHYLSVPAATIRYWSVGRGDHLPLIEVPSPSSPTLVSFLNLTELHVLSALRREHKVKMPAVRDAIEHLSKLATTSLDRRHPLVSRVLETDGLHVFTDYYGQLINLSRSGQAVIREVIAGALKRIERDRGGVPIKLYPFTRYSIRNAPATVLIDPALAGGRPVIAGTGLATQIIAERYKLGESISELADDYERPDTEIEEAIRCELEAAA